MTDHEGGQRVASLPVSSAQPAAHSSQQPPTFPPLLQPTGAATTNGLPQSLQTTATSHDLGQAAFAPQQQLQITESLSSAALPFFPSDLQQQLSFLLQQQQQQAPLPSNHTTTSHQDQNTAGQFQQTLLQQESQNHADVQGSTMMADLSAKSNHVDQGSNANITMGPDPNANNSNSSQFMNPQMFQWQLMQQLMNPGNMMGLAMPQPGSATNLLAPFSVAAPVLQVPSIPDNIFATANTFWNGLMTPMPASIIGQGTALAAIPSSCAAVAVNTVKKRPVSQTWAEPSEQGKKEPPFPLKLHRILSNPEFSEYITWNPRGTSWRILKPSMFESVVLPLFFRHKKRNSFMRQVNGWGFARVGSGSNESNFYAHADFVRDDPDRCLKMKRVPKKAKSKGEGKAKGTDDDEDDSGKDSTSQKEESFNQKEEADGLDQADCSSQLGDDMPQQLNEQSPFIDVAEVSAAVQTANAGSQSNNPNPCSGPSNLAQSYGIQGYQAMNPYAMGGLCPDLFALQQQQQPQQRSALNQMNMLQGMMCNPAGGVPSLNGFAGQTYIQGLFANGMPNPVTPSFPSADRNMPNTSDLQGASVLNLLLGSLASGQSNLPPSALEPSQRPSEQLASEPKHTHQAAVAPPSLHTSSAAAVDPAALQSLHEALLQAQAQVVDQSQQTAQNSHCQEKGLPVVVPAVESPTAVSSLTSPPTSDAEQSLPLPTAGHATASDAPSMSGALGV